MTYRIRLLGLSLDCSICPPPIVSAVFPDFAGERVTLSPTECLVEFDGPRVAVDLGPLVVVEEVSPGPGE